MFLLEAGVCNREQIINLANCRPDKFTGLTLASCFSLHTEFLLREEWNLRGLLAGWAVTASLGLVLFSGGAWADANSKRTVIDIAGDSGGQIASYDLRVSSVKRSGARVRFVGRCDSACTLFLSLPKHRMCIDRGAAFGFHLPFGASSNSNRTAAKYLRGKYPGWVRSWISARGGLTNQLKIMSYTYASRFIPPCKSKLAGF